MVTKYYGDVSIQDSGAPQKPRVVTLNNMVAFDFPDLNVEYNPELEN
jgi:hypothetical protein